MMLGGRGLLLNKLSNLLNTYADKAQPHYKAQGDLFLHCGKATRHPPLSPGTTPCKQSFSCILPSARSGWRFDTLISECAD
jgi:hypothetical protein